MADNVTLSSAVRTNLLSLNKTADSVNRTNSRLSTGLKVASAVDDAVAYFQAKGLSDRAGDLTSRKESIDQAVSSVKSAIGGLESVEKILTQMKGVALSAKSATDADRTELASQFNTLATQLTNLVNDTSYQGLNLVNSTAASLKVEFSDKTAAVLTIKGVDVRSSKLKGLAVAGSVAATAATDKKWSAVSAKVSSLDAIIKKLDSAISTVRSNVKTLGGNVALLQTRLDFTKNYVNTLKEGSDKLTLADLNEEGANLVSLQTRQQLGIQALSFAGQQEQGVLSLFR
ncbi:MAG: flagellin [Rhodospirillaceae bacterium]|nr:flagellin [Rhodospirillales bacterium]